MKFIDEVKIRVAAGKGGNGCVSFRREKYVPRGGPDGGDGGLGGSVIIEATERKHSLLDFRYRNIFAASNGRGGEGQNRHGRSGEDMVLEVPVGTIAKDVETGDILADLKESGQRWTAAAGGRGGKGNAHFTSSTHRSPRFAQEGEAGEERELRLELKLIADVGLVGLPNAGKSTLISAISAARPKIADYPFTTLVPNLGVVRYHEDAPPFVVADVPGLIKGAHEGVGLGVRFLKHIERTRVLVHVIDISALSADDFLEPFRQIEFELSSYSQSLAEKPKIIVLNKIDLVPDDFTHAAAEHYKQLGFPVLLISSLKKEGLRDLVRLLTSLLADMEG